MGFFIVEIECSNKSAKVAEVTLHPSSFLTFVSIGIECTGALVRNGPQSQNFAIISNF